VYRKKDFTSGCRRNDRRGRYWAAREDAYHVLRALLVIVSSPKQSKVQKRSTDKHEQNDCLLIVVICDIIR
jgi:hypothetical protein